MDTKKQERNAEDVGIPQSAEKDREQDKHLPPGAPGEDISQIDQQEGDMKNGELGANFHKKAWT